MSSSEEMSMTEERAGISLGKPFFYDLSGRAKLRFEGPQALWFLDQLVTNKVDELAPGSGTEALLLTPNGRITSHIRIVHRLDSEDGVPDAYVDAPNGHSQLLMDFFGMRVFATKVGISDVTQEFAIVRVMGPEAAVLAAGVLGSELPGPDEHANRRFSSAGIQGLALRVAMPAAGFDLWVPSESKQDLVEKLGAAGVQPLDDTAYDALRIAAGVPQYGTDFAEGHLPQEAAFERSVHFSKGCYLGQEAVAMAQRGRIKRRLRHLEFDSVGVTGKVVHGQTEAGRVTSAAEFNGRWFGIGTVRTDVAVGDRVLVIPDGPDDSAGQDQGMEAIVGDLPGTTYGPRVPSARELREKLQSG